MKWLIGIVLTLSLAANGYFIWNEIRYGQRMEWGKSMEKAFGGKVEDVSWTKGLAMLKDSIKKKHPELADKKYFYVNMWAMFCGPCIKEMPWLDSLAGTMERKDVAYIFLAGESDKATNAMIERKKFKIKNFVYLNNMSDFISAVYTEQKKKSISYPTIVIFDNKDKIIKYETGAYENKNEAKEFVDLIRDLE